MPISRDQFERNLSERQARLLAFLKQHPDEAFTELEILIEIGEQQAELPFTRYLQVMTMQQALKELEERGMVMRRLLDQQSYYAIKS